MKHKKFLMEVMKLKNKFFEKENRKYHCVNVSLTESMS